MPRSKRALRQALRLMWGSARACCRAWGRGSRCNSCRCVSLNFGMCPCRQLGQLQSCSKDTQSFTLEIKQPNTISSAHSAGRAADAKCSVVATCPGSPSHCIYAPRCSNISPSPHAPHPQRSTAHAQRPLSTAKVTVCASGVSSQQQQWPETRACS